MGRVGNSEAPVDKYPKLKVIEHALAAHKLTLMRDQSKSFSVDLDRYRRLMREIGLILCGEVTRDLALAKPTKGKAKDGTPLDGRRLQQQKLAIVPILRAGLALADAFFELLPSARAGHIGLFRDYENATITRYLMSIPRVPETDFIILDPIIATSATICAATDMLLDEFDIPASRIRIASVVASKQGIERFYEDERHSEVRIFVCAIDDGWDAEGLPIPGIGEPGDRLYGTDRQHGVRN